MFLYGDTSVSEHVFQPQFVSLLRTCPKSILGPNTGIGCHSNERNLIISNFKMSDIRCSRVIIGKGRRILPTHVSILSRIIKDDECRSRTSTASSRYLHNCQGSMLLRTILSNHQVGTTKQLVKVIPKFTILNKKLESRDLLVAYFTPEAFASIIKESLAFAYLFVRT